MGKVGKIVGYSLAGVVGAGVVLAGGGYLYISSGLNAKRAQVYETHSDVDFPVPWPLTEAEVDVLRAQKLAELAPLAEALDETEAEPVSAKGAEPVDDGAIEVIPAAVIDPLEGVDLNTIALERAILRGEHLTKARYGCVVCHGVNYAGGTMIDDPMMGSWQGKNLTAGAGTATANYTPRDWDRIVRHGVKPDGTAGIMPSDDFTLMSDRELSDIVAFIGSLPPIDNQVPDPTFGPISSVLIATGTLQFSAERLYTNKLHAKLPPPAEDTKEFGRHLTGVCQGCHRPSLNGGKIDIGPPDWPPAANLTHANEALHSYTFEQFNTLMRTGVRADGSEVAFPMTEVMSIADHNTEIEMRAMWTYLNSLEAKPTGQ